MATADGIPVNPVIPDDPFGDIKEAKYKRFAPPQEVNEFHTRSDVDSAATAHHHTLGIKHNQAAPGDHIHDGIASKKLMDGVIITGSRGGNAALADLLTKLSEALGFTNNTTA